MSFLDSTGKRGDYISQDGLIFMREVDATNLKDNEITPGIKETIWGIS